MLISDRVMIKNFQSYLIVTKEEKTVQRSKVVTTVVYVFVLGIMDSASGKALKGVPEATLIQLRLHCFLVV
jgi:hypothetical protein